MSTSTPPGGGIRVLRIAVRGVALAVVAAGVVWVVTSLNAPRRQVAAHVSDYADLCGGRAIPQAPAYAGSPGVHPVVVIGNDQDDPVGRGNQIRLPRELDAAAFDPPAAAVQLVACAKHVDDGPAVATCPFNEVVATMHRATVEVAVYEARTGERIVEPVTMVAEDTTCPSVISYEGSKPKVFSRPAPQQILAVVAPLAAP